MKDPLAFEPDWLKDRLDRGEVILLDGAMGTELERRGVPMDQSAWSGAAVMTHPDTVRAIHADYIDAGADVIIVNSFASGRHSLAPAGLGDHVRSINTDAVRLAKEARDSAADRPVAVAGSICEWVPREGSTWSHNEALKEALAEQAHLLAEAGVDMLVLEMCQRWEHSELAFEAAKATGLPIWVGASCRRKPTQSALSTFDADTDPNFETLVTGLAQLGPRVLSVMHSPIADTVEGVEIVKGHWDGPLGVYPESGHFIMPNWQFVDIIDPDDLVAQAHMWLDLGVQVIGGCCGLGPDHIRALSQAIRR
ncbi:MAG: homocysteine S-methyltransferase family protein [Pseudomonadota bacterium]